VYKGHHINILARQRNGTRYVGITSNLIEREHAEILSINPLNPPALGTFGVRRHPQTPGRKYPAPLFPTVSKVMGTQEQSNERFSKKYNRRWKLESIEKENPEWRDLYTDSVSGLPDQVRR
jgi:putative endonuclease